MKRYEKIIITIFILLILITSLFLTTNNKKIDDTKYIGKYIDPDIKDINLIIEKNQDNTYSVKIGIYRIAWLDDGIGKLTKKGLKFTATDPSGEKKSGIINIKKDIATVKFTNSTWAYIHNGNEYKYKKLEE